MAPVTAAPWARPRTGPSHSPAADSRGGSVHENGRTGQLPDAHPSWTTPRSRRSGPLEQGAQAHGFEADLWTLERVGAVVTPATGVVLSRASVWRLLTGRLGWSLQRPERRAVERNESESARWIAYEWPRIKKGPRTHVPGSSSSTNQASPYSLRSAAPTRPEGGLRSCGTA
ncbi:helix-turn-helix domain-containing protein [Streptomyces sp. JV185]|uniref:helix-turn-helix domain-containing protein n=1 Tax=Streptomyces sp. JV185 TaxID=858638 RepID=UPI003FA6AD51